MADPTCPFGMLINGIYKFAHEYSSGCESSALDLSLRFNLMGHAACRPSFWDDAYPIATSMNMSREAAKYANSLGTSHAERLQAIKTLLQEGVADEIKILVWLCDGIYNHQKVVQMLVDVLPAHTQVRLRLEMEGRDVVDGDWSVAARALARHDIYDLFVDGAPARLMTAAIAPSLRDLYIAKLLHSEHLEGVDWQLLQGSPLLTKVTLLGTAPCQAVLDNITGPLVTLELVLSPADNDATPLRVPSQAVDSSTAVTLDEWYHPTSFPPRISVKRIADGEAPTAEPLFNPRTHGVAFMGDTPSDCLHWLLQDALVVKFMNEDICPMALASSGVAYPSVQAFYYWGFGYHGPGSGCDGPCLNEPPERWHAIFPGASVVLYYSREGSDHVSLLRNPSSPIGVQHYGSILQVHAQRCNERPPQSGVGHDDVLWPKLLEVAVATDALQWHLPDDVSSSILRAWMMQAYNSDTR